MKATDGKKKMSAVMNRMETKRIVPRIIDTKSWFFKLLTKIDKSLATFVKRRSEKAYFTKIRDEILRIIWKSSEKLYSNELKNLEEMDKFLDEYDLQKLTQDYICSLNRSLKLMKLKQ
jgi:predicted transcriptional regulator